MVGRGVLDAPTHDCGGLTCGGSGSPALPRDCGGLGGESSVGRDVLGAPSHDCGGLGGGSGSPALPCDCGVMPCGGSGSPALPYRKRLSHAAPLRVDARNAIYFITICAADRATANWVGRGINDAPPAATILNAARHYHRIGKWFVHFMVVMPDHLHALISFGASGVGGGSGVDGGSRTPRPTEDMGIVSDECDGVVGRARPQDAPPCGFGGSRTPRPTDAPRPTMMATVSQWKSYVAKAAGIRFQRDFWDTRIRDGSHLAERVDYMAKNPVRRGLSRAPEEWAWRFKGGDFKTGLRAAEDVRPYQRR